MPDFRNIAKAIIAKILPKRPVPIAYSCSTCGVTAAVLDGTVVRPCEHKTAGVVADISATAYGIGSAKAKQILGD